MDVESKKCSCGKPFDSQQFSVKCDVCKFRYHGKCAGVEEYMSTDIDKFHCHLCQKNHGSSLMKLKINNHRHDYSEKEAHTKPVQTGTPLFIKELKSRHFLESNDIVKYLKGQQLTLAYLESNGFETPIIVNDKESLNMVLPPSTFSLHEIENYIGGDYEMDVIDVAKQNNIRMKLNEFIEYYNSPHRTRVFNVISLEFTNTRLSPLVEAPFIAQKLDWVNYVWPQNWPSNSELKRPEVQKYCLIGVKDSFTDFHIDFGGTSVWYHVLRGEKVFYFIRPTQANLYLYQQWMCSSTQNETFFGDQVDACYKCILRQGQTMMIPTGWIHAVLTPVDSLVFGGNFVHSLNIPLQLKIYEMEKKMKTPIKFQYPNFETINWLAAKNLLKELKNLNGKEKKCSLYFLQGLKALLSMLKQWNTDKDYNMISRSQIPITINSQKLLKDLSKEIRYADKLFISLNSSRIRGKIIKKKKKLPKKDFLNFEITNSVTNNSNNNFLKTQNSMKNLLITKDKTLANLYLQNRIMNEKQEIPHFSTSVTKFKKIDMKKREVIANDNVRNKNISELNNIKNNISSNKIRDGKDEILHFEKSNPTFIRFKLGNEEIVRSTNQSKDNIYNDFMSHKDTIWKKTPSIYDFHDSSNDSENNELTIDESLKKSKINESFDVKKYLLYNDKFEDSANIPTNGIEELLKASAYTSAPDIKLNVSSPKSKVDSMSSKSTGSDRTSQSTRDAIAGMLFFSGQPYSINSNSVSNSSKIKSNNCFEGKNKSDNDNEDDDDDDEEDDLSIENIDKIHQDDDFIYPALDISDEDEFFFKLKGKKIEDEAWNPKAKVGPLLPKTNRPIRDGAKKSFIEKDLEAAAKKRARNLCTKQSLKTSKKNISVNIKKMITSKSAMETINNTPIEVLEPMILSKNTEYIHTYSTILTNSNRLNDVKAKLAASISIDRKPKKGMKTAKQRLGKILKIHKMLH